MGGRIARYPSIALTGHRMSPMIPMCIVTPAPNGSVLLFFKRTARRFGDLCESTDISSGESMLGVKDL